MKQLFGFHGRISRGEYAGISIGTFILMALVRILATGMAAAIAVDNPQSTAVGAMGLALLLNAPLLWVYFAAAAKRLHDMDQSGWWSLLLLIPYAGIAVWIAFVAIPGTAGRNRHDGPARQSQVAEVFD